MLRLKELYDTRQIDINGVIRAIQNNWITEEQYFDIVVNDDVSLNKAKEMLDSYNK